MRFFFLIIVSCFCIQAHSQSFTKYYDSNWQEVLKAQSFYYGNFIKQDNVYHAAYYWADSNQLYDRSVYIDSNFNKQTGNEIKYFRSGKIKDSLVYSDNGNLLFYDEFKENGKQDFHAFFDEKEKYMKAERFDNNGNKLPGYFTFQKPAMFPGGMQGWITYLQTHLKADIPTRKKAPLGNYTVIVSFLVMKDGKINEVKAENDPGYGTAEEAVRVIKNGPDWIPAIQNNKPVIYRQKQNITFQVNDAKR